MRPAPIACITLLLAACGSPQPADNAAARDAGSESINTQGASAASAAKPRAPTLPVPSESRDRAGRWSLQRSAGGTDLALLTAPGATTMRLSCPAGKNQLRVNVPAFRPIGSEERLSFGGGGEVVALVADSGGDARNGGVTGAGAVPAALATMLKGEISASYGAQHSGPYPAPPQAAAKAFVAACAAAAAAAPTKPAAPAGACLMQGSERLSVRPLRAVGTEPFWGARIEGRCVTYSHPEDQAGTRIWTRYSAAAGGGTWSGALGGRRFELRTRAAPDCSDGMSDKKYPIAVELIVGGEHRKGCAAPL